MLGTLELIDEVLVQHHGISSAKTASATYATLRARVLRNARRAGKKLYNLRDWTWRYVDGGTVTLLANQNAIALPGTWVNEGREGAVWLPDGTPLIWRPVREVRHQQRLNGSQTGDPTVYSVDLLRSIIVDFKAQANTVLTLHYQTSSPILTDANPGGLTLFPEEWHDLIYEMTVFRELKDKGDIGQMPAQVEMIRDMLFDAVCSESPGQHQAQELPRYPGAADVFFLDDWP